VITLFLEGLLVITSGAMAPTAVRQLRLRTGPFLAGKLSPQSRLRLLVIGGALFFFNLVATAILVMMTASRKPTMSSTIITSVFMVIGIYLTATFSHKEEATTTP
jgi:hypothetical protein